MRVIIILLVAVLLTSCAATEYNGPPRRWLKPQALVLEVKGEGAYFPALGAYPPIIVVRDIRDPLVVPHEGGHEIWDATGQPQQYP